MIRTKQELINIFEEKLINAQREHIAKIAKGTNDPSEIYDRAELVGEQKIYFEVIAFLKDTEIVNDTLCHTCKENATCEHKARSGKEAVKCTEYNPFTIADGNVVERVERKNKEVY